MNDFEQLGQLAEIISTIHSAEASDFPQALDALTQTAARCVPGAQDAGISVSSRKNAVTTPSVTHENARMLDEIQQRHLEGPCLEAAWTRKVIVVDDLGNDSRWPGYRKEALAQTPIRSILSLPMFADEVSMGALNFYADHAQAFTDISRRVAAGFATLGAVAWSNVVRQEQFKAALDSRDIIGQAKGILMERYDLDNHAAFNMLVELSQSMNIPLREIARRLIDDTNQR